jgi:hypothetical protein
MLPEGFRNAEPAGETAGAEERHAGRLGGDGQIGREVASGVTIT